VPAPSSRSRLLKRLIWVAVLAALIAGGVYATRYYRAKNDTGPKYETAKVDQGRITAKVTATGTVSALVTVLVGSQVSGRIAMLAADFNSQVKKGQVIAKIDPELFKAAMAQAQANYIAAKGNLAKAKAQAEDAARQAERSKQLADKNLIAAADRDTAVSNAAAAAAQVEATGGSVAQAQAALHQAQVNLNYTTIVSPIDGQVISRSVDVGQTVAASLQAPTLFTIAEDLKKMQVDTNVAEADVGKLQAGMPATFTVDAYPSQRFRGTVRQIRNAPQTVQNVVTYDAVIDVDNGELKLKPGMTANVTFTYEDKADVIRVPNIALRFRPPSELMPGASASSGQKWAGAPGAAAGDARTGGRRRGGADGERPADSRTVWVLQGTTPLPRAVRVGVSDGTLTEIVEGNLKAGELVLTGIASDAAQSSAAKPALGGGQQPARRAF
jgi:HlyD family secretion protein